jgi:hypothetical protein
MIIMTHFKEWMRSGIVLHSVKEKPSIPWRPMERHLSENKIVFLYFLRSAILLSHVLKILMSLRWLLLTWLLNLIILNLLFF